ncbi:MAG: DUF362 domain-containing protein [Nitrospinae bacterium]|nr:DUF362 domain-containing protein [Nitrospinota bacterium]
MDSDIYIAKCDSYDGDAIYKLLLEFFGYIGGAEKWIKPGMEVLIKPNLCLAHPPEMAITTHPTVIEQAARIAMECGANVSIGDNPIGKFDQRHISRIWEVAGMNAIVERLGCGKSILDKKGFRKETFELNGNTADYYISREYLSADLVINIPKFKTHALMGFTGAVKNIYGIIPGRSKLRLHGFAPGVREFSRIIADVYSKRIPEVTIMDAVEGLEGNGPGTGGVKRKVGLLMASSDGVLLDSICSRVIGVDPNDIATNISAREKGLGSMNPRNVYLSGIGRLEDAYLRDFKIPSTMRYKNSKVVEKLFNIARFKIRIQPDKCKDCFLCFKNCPVEAIGQAAGKRLQINEAQCIQCLCCLELCPHGAVDASTSRFYSELKRLRARS